ncbi:MAG: hypothetical protein AAF355_12120 [Myxococcota bacterium]
MDAPYDSWPAGPSSRPPLVLLVHRLPQTRSTIAAAIEMAGCEVCATDTESSAIELIDAVEPNILVFDPNMSAFTIEELSKLIKNCYPNRSVPIVPFVDEGHEDNTHEFLSQLRLLSAQPCKYLH